MTYTEDQLRVLKIIKASKDYTDDLYTQIIYDSQTDTFVFHLLLEEVQTPQGWEEKWVAVKNDDDLHILQQTLAEFEEKSTDETRIDTELSEIISRRISRDFKVSENSVNQAPMVSVEEFHSQSKAVPSPIVLTEEELDTSAVLFDLLRLIKVVDEASGYFYRFVEHEYNYETLKFDKVSSRFRLLSDCSDFFAFASADAENITAHNFHLMSQAQEIVYRKTENQEVTEERKRYLTGLLFATLLRKTRPVTLKRKRIPESLIEDFSAV